MVHSSGGRKPKIQVSLGLVLSEGGTRRICSMPFSLTPMAVFSLGMSVSKMSFLIKTPIILA